MCDPRRTDPIAERAVRRQYWFSLDYKKADGAEAMECYCILRNVQDLLADCQTPCERCWFNSPFEGPIIPFGAEIKFYPISSQISSAPKSFLEYSLEPP